ncbi:NADP-dependent oxidoreductase [Microbacterium sp. cx-59]|uniref:quinone oxidoreductase family protein n=1 Tax=Microbacterium sp. cx-59 TaxID=2891207 RepID=UPI001E30858F|nr:NADP-dependent oxidoreductase [Microbacterium sp. cx-59]MCC4906723.1 NADP-dependent oxidoreductase [Microbacterium sp. cx-59]
MTQAIVYSEHGGPDVLRLIELDTPAPGPGQVAVRVEAAGVNPIDGKLRSGLRGPGPMTAPRRIGNDGAGVITAVGEGVDGFRPGDEVVLFGASGVYATDVVVTVSAVQPRPPQVSAAQGAALGIPVGTAYQSLRSLAVGPGDTVLVHAGSGAVGQAAIQLAALWGATVIATASPARFDRLRELGAVPVAYGDGLEERVRAAAPQGVTVALDAAGTDEAIQTSLAVVADPTRIATIVRGPDAAGFGIRAFSGGSPEPLTDQQQAWRAEAVPVVLALMAAGRFTVELGPEFALADAVEAHRVLASGANGKITLVP